MRGVWIAYTPGWATFAVFSAEKDALRHAMASDGMTVGFCAFGTVIDEDTKLPTSAPAAPKPEEKPKGTKGSKDDDF